MVHCDCFLRQSETSCVPKVQQSMNTLKRIAKKRDQRFRSGSNIVSDGQPLISSQLLPITLNLAPRCRGGQLVVRDSGGPHRSTAVSESSPTKCRRMHPNCLKQG